MHATQYGIKARGLEFKFWLVQLNKIIVACSYSTSEAWGGGFLEYKWIAHLSPRIQVNWTQTIYSETFITTIWFHRRHVVTIWFRRITVNWKACREPQSSDSACHQQKQKTKWPEASPWIMYVGCRHEKVHGANHSGYRVKLALWEQYSPRCFFCVLIFTPAASMGPDANRNAWRF